MVTHVAVLVRDTDSMFFYVQSANERLYNKARKSEITTRMKKVFMNAQALMAADSCSESDISSLEKLIS